MKKKIQIVTIPLDKQGWSKNDIIMTKDRKKSIFSITSADFGTFMTDELLKNSWKAQQLLILSDDEIQEDDCILTDARAHINDSPEYDIETCIAIENSWIYGSKDKFDIGHNPDWTRKIIASYPHIEGTLPLSKETVQAWIDAGTPVEGSVEYVYLDMLSPIDGVSPDYYYNPKIDRQGNLLLEFDGESPEQVKDIDTNQYNFTIQQILEAITYGFEYHRDSIHDNIDVPEGNKLQWILSKFIDPLKHKEFINNFKK